MTTIRAKMITNLLILLVTIIAIMGLEYYNINALGVMQDLGAKRSDQALQARETSLGGLALYRVIADAEINRDLEKAAADWNAKKAEVMKTLALTLEDLDTPEEKKLGAQVKGDLEAIVKIFEGEMLPLLKGGDAMTPEIRALDDKVDALVTKVESGMDPLAASLQKEMEQSDADFDTTRRNALLETVVVGIAGLLLQVVIGLLLLKSVTGSLHAIREILAAVSEGDLTRQITIRSKDELGDMSRQFNGIIERLHDMINRISRTSSQVVAASGQLTSAAGQIATGAEEVAAPVRHRGARTLQQRRGAAGAGAAVQGVTGKTQQLSISIRSRSASAAASSYCSKSSRMLLMYEWIKNSSSSERPPFCSGRPTRDNFSLNCSQNGLLFPGRSMWRRSSAISSCEFFSPCIPAKET